MLKRLRKTLVMLGECFRMSLSNILGNRVRSFLTVLGILIGVTAVIALITTVSGFSGTLSSSFQSMGAGTLSVSVTGSDLKSGMSAGDLQEIASLEMVEGVTPNVSLRTRIARGGSYKTSVSVSGKNFYYFYRNADALKRGRPIHPTPAPSTTMSAAWPNGRPRRRSTTPTKPSSSSASRKARWMSTIRQSTTISRRTGSVFPSGIWCTSATAIRISPA